MKTGHNQNIFISFSNFLNSGSPVSSVAFCRFDNAAAKQSAYAIECSALMWAAANARSSSISINLMGNCLILDKVSCASGSPLFLSVIYITSPRFITVIFIKTSSFNASVRNFSTGPLPLSSAK